MVRAPRPPCQPSPSKGSVPRPPGTWLSGAFPTGLRSPRLPVGEALASVPSVLALPQRRGPSILASSVHSVCVCAPPTHAVLRATPADNGSCLGPRGSMVSSGHHAPGASPSSVHRAWWPFPNSSVAMAAAPQGCGPSLQVLSCLWAVTATITSPCSGSVCVLRTAIPACPQEPPVCVDLGLKPSPSLLSLPSSFFLAHCTSCRLSLPYYACI